MWTLPYKNAYIHGHFNRGNCKVHIGNRTLIAKSLHSAKCLIAQANRGR